MNRVFYIFRHGETDWNKEKRCQGHTDVKLNENGLAQAEALAERMKGIHLDVIISSDLGRALVTGKTVAAKKATPFNADPRLREMSCGEAEGMLFTHAIEKYGVDLWDNLTSFKVEHDDICFPSGETRRSARERFLSVLHEIIEKTDYQSIGISTHGGILRNALHSFLPEDHPVIQIPNCILYRLTYDGSTKTFHFDAKPFECLLT